MVQYLLSFLQNNFKIKIMKKNIILLILLHSNLVNFAQSNLTEEDKKELTGVTERFVDCASHFKKIAVVVDSIQIAFIGKESITENEKKRLDGINSLLRIQITDLKASCLNEINFYGDNFAKRENGISNKEAITDEMKIYFYHEIHKIDKELYSLLLRHKIIRY